GRERRHRSTPWPTSGRHRGAADRVYGEGEPATMRTITSAAVAGLAAVAVITGCSGDGGGVDSRPGTGHGGPVAEASETDFGPPALDADGREAVDFGRVGRLSIGMTYADVRGQGVDPVSVAGFGACTDAVIQMPTSVPVILTFSDDDSQLVRIQSMGWTTALIDAEPT